MADVFISYARADQSAARRVGNALQAAGLDVWWDADLPAHRAYSDVIEDKLKEARAVVVLWSAAAASSQWVRAEADFARSAGKLVQAQLDGTLPPMPFNQIQCADLQRWKGAASHPGWTKLGNSVEALLAGEGPRPAPAPNRTPSTIRRWRWPAAAALALLVIASISLLTFGRHPEETKPVVAVLPFKSLDSNDESLAAGMWEDTRQAIGRNPQLIVLGPNTVQQLAEKGAGATKKAADYVVEASIRTAGDRIRISTDLVRTKDGQQLWGQDFDRKLDDVFALQSEIASNIEGRIRGRLAEKGGVTPEHIATSGEVYALYSDARAKIRSRDPAAVVSAYDQLERVVALDPNFAPGWATLSEVEQFAPASKNYSGAANPAEQHARKAIELAPNLAAAHAALAFALNLNGPVARAEIERAVQLDPNDYEAANWLGIMRTNAGDLNGAANAYWHAVAIEPLFYPAAFNLADVLEQMHDSAAMERLLVTERRAGADYLAAAAEVHYAFLKGDLAKAANLGLTYWGRPEARNVMQDDLWGILLELGFPEEGFNTGGATPDFAPYIWRNDPKGLELFEAHRFDARTFFARDPITQNLARVYLLSGRGAKVAELYLSLNASPEEFAALTGESGRFLQVAPFVGLALTRSGHTQEGSALLALAEQKARDGLKDGTPESAALLARVYGAQGRKEDALQLLVNAVSRGWLPHAPQFQPDLRSDPAVASLKGDPRFEKLRAQILETIARERAQVNLNLLRQLSTPDAEKKVA